MSADLNNLRQFGDFRLDAEKKVLWWRDSPVNLHLKEIELLCLLTGKSGEVVTKAEMLDTVWAGSFIDEGNISKHVHRIRKVLAEHGAERDLIQTIPRRGYRFTGRVASPILVANRTVIETVIEEFESDPAPPVLLSGKIRRRFIPIAAAALLLISIVAAVTIFYSASGDTPQIRSIAVLPLRSLDGDRALGLGFADSLITQLGDLEQVRVLSIGAVSGFADESGDPIEFARGLKVDTVVEGTIQRAGSTYIVNLRAARVSDGTQLWSRSFSAPESDIFRLHDEISSRTAEALSLKILDRRRGRTLTDDVAAYHLYLQGRYLFRRRENAEAFFRKATELDPEFAAAWAALGAHYAFIADLPKARGFVEKALSIDPDLAEAHASLGFIRMFADWDWEGAEASLTRAIALDPNLVEGRHWLGVLHTIRGRFAEAEAEIGKATQLEPASAILHHDLADVSFFKRDYEMAEELYYKAELLKPGIAVSRLGEIRYLRGMDSGFRERAEASIADISTRINSPGGGETSASILFELGVKYAQLGNSDAAITYIERAVSRKAPFEQLSFTLPFAAINPVYEPLQGDPRFQKIIADAVTGRNLQ